MVELSVTGRFEVAGSGGVDAVDAANRRWLGLAHEGGGGGCFFQPWR